VAIPGCFAFNAAQDNGACIPCNGATDADDDMAAVGANCTGGYYNAASTSCIGSGRIDADCCHAYLTNHACSQNLDNPHTGVVCCSDTLLETIVVPVDGSSVTSTTILANGVTYDIRASGTFRIGGPGDGLGDAEYADFSNPPASVFSRCFYDPNGLDFGLVINNQVNGNEKFPNWGPYSPTHVYSIAFPGAGAPITFSYFDCPTTDNSGSLTVDILRP